MRKLLIPTLGLLVAGAIAPAANPIKKSAPPPSPIDRMIHEAELAGATGATPASSPGSLYHTGGPLADFTTEFRARAVNDIVTVVVADQATAVTNGTTNTQRKSSTANGI